MKIKSLLISILLATSCYSYADSESKQAKLNELVNIMDMDSMVDQMYSQMEAMMQNMSTQMGVQPSEQEIFDDYYSQMVLIMNEEMSWAKMEPLIVNIYDNNFTEEEINDILAFYKTETGQSLLLKMPAVMQESMQISQTLMQASIPKIQELAKNLSEDLAKSRNSQ